MNLFHLLKRKLNPRGKDVLLFKDVFQHLASCDPSYTCLPSEDEWSHASDLCQFLKVFYDATNLFSASKQVTSNLVFEEVLSIYHHLRRHRGTSNEHMRALICKMQEKFDKYFKSYNILFAIAVVLDPRFKLSYLKYLLDDLDKPDAMVKYEAVEKILHELYVEYKNMYDESDASNMRMDNACTSTMIATEEYRSVARFAFKAYVNSVSPVVALTDLDKYLTDPMEEIAHNADFNILSWWKTNESKYKIVAKMARDVLAIPVSTVASESAFSIAGRILNDYRCSTTPENVESLICTQSWIRDAHNLGESSHDAEHHSDEES